MRWTLSIPTRGFRAVRLPEPFHKDPADRIIVATAMTMGVPVMSSDARILEYPHVKAIWKREHSRFVRKKDWTKGFDFSSVRVPRRHTWVMVGGTSSGTTWVRPNST